MDRCINCQEEFDIDDLEDGLCELCYTEYQKEIDSEQ